MGAPVVAASAGAAFTWSLWAWVQTMAVSLRSPTASAMAIGVVGSVDHDDLVFVPDDP
jgi:hypothetical protein